MMFSLTDKVKHNFTNTPFIATSLVLLLIIFIRMTRGLDLTDEMQYYGEIKGLIETGKLFSNDLFIQQLVYILLYPAFYIYHSVLGFEGLVFFGRLLMAVLCIAVFIYAYRKLLVFKFPAPIAGLTALSLTFAIPYHGIFAPSYNTISQALWIIFTLRFFEWKKNDAISWSVIPMIMAFAHPISAVMMVLLIFLRLLVERELKRILEILWGFLSGVLIAAPVIFYFATPTEYWASIMFSSGYGAGEAFFSSKSQPIVLAVIYTMFGSCLLFWRLFHRLGFALLTSVLITVTIVLFSSGLVGGGYSTRVVYVLSFLSAFTCCWSLSNTSVGDENIRQRINWLVVALLVYATALGVTSGNGIGQATGAFMVGLPLLLGIAVSSELRKQSSSSFNYLKISSVVLVCILFIAHWSRYPYREDGWWLANKTIQSVPEFRLISSSQERNQFIQYMKNALGPVTQGKRTLIIGEYPGLYFVSEAHAETCMFFMHSLTSDRSEEALLNCLVKKKPEVIVDIFTNNDIELGNSRIKNVMHNYYHQRGFHCSVELVKLNLISKQNPEQLKYSVCI